VSTSEANPWQGLKYDDMDPFEQAMIGLAIEDAGKGRCFVCETGPPDHISGALTKDGRMVVYPICRRCIRSDANVSKAIEKADAAGAIFVKLPSKGDGRSN
jgi:hypothetical protein